MKTQNNNQKTSRNQVSKMVLYSSAIILSVVLIGKTTKAQNYWDQLSRTKSDGNLATLVTEPSSETQQVDAVFEIIEAEVNTQLNNSKEPKGVFDPSLNSYESNMEATLEYNPNKFVEAEMELEIEKLASNESVEVDSAPQIESLMNEVEYNADRFVEKEMKMEMENESINEEFLKSAEASTAIETEQEIAKYAEQIISNEKTKEALAGGSEMTNKSFFNEAEQYTADGADHEIAKYAEMIKNIEETGEGFVAESWMQSTESFNSQQHYDQYKVR